MPPVIGEERPDCFLDEIPTLGSAFCYASQTLVIAGKPAMLPQMHLEKRIGAVLLCIDMGSLSQFIADINRHPR